MRRKCTIIVHPVKYWKISRGNKTKIISSTVYLQISESNKAANQKFMNRMDDRERK